MRVLFDCDVIAVVHCFLAVTNVHANENVIVGRNLTKKTYMATAGLQRRCEYMSCGACFGAESIPHQQRRMQEGRSCRLVGSESPEQLSVGRKVEGAQCWRHL